MPGNKYPSQSSSSSSTLSRLAPVVEVLDLETEETMEILSPATGPSLEEMIKTSDEKALSFVYTEGVRTIQGLQWQLNNATGSIQQLNGILRGMVTSNQALNDEVAVAEREKSEAIEQMQSQMSELERRNQQLQSQLVEVKNEKEEAAKTARWQLCQAIGKSKVLAVELHLTEQVSKEYQNAAEKSQSQLNKSKLENQQLRSQLAKAKQASQGTKLPQQPSRQASGPSFFPTEKRSYRPSEQDQYIQEVSQHFRAKGGRFLGAQSDSDEEQSSPELKPRRSAQSDSDEEPSSPELEQRGVDQHNNDSQFSPQFMLLGISVRNNQPWEPLQSSNIGFGSY